MKRTLLAIALGCALLNVNAQQLRTPAPSSTQIIKQELGIGTVELSYSRPGMKGRKIFGDLVPFDKVWRTGANNATTLTFSDEVIIGGTKVPAGKYGLLSIPGKDNWTLIITKQTDVTSPAAYKMENDVVRVMAKPVTVKDGVETFTMQFSNIKSNAADLNITWENTSVTLPLTADVDGKVMTQIDNLVNKDTRPYFAAGLYYLNNGKDLNKALEWFNKSIEQDPKAYWAYHQKANTLAKLGKKDEAKATALKSIEIAKEAKNDDYVALNEKLIATLK